LTLRGRGLPNPVRPTGDIPGRLSPGSLLPAGGVCRKRLPRLHRDRDAARVATSGGRATARGLEAQTNSLTHSLRAKLQPGLCGRGEASRLPSKVWSRSARSRRQRFRAGPWSGSRRSIAPSRPTAATCTRSSSGSYGLSYRLAKRRASGRKRWTSASLAPRSRSDCQRSISHSTVRSSRSLALDIQTGDRSWSTQISSRRETRIQWSAAR
jgi:hypothetical protein